MKKFALLIVMILPILTFCQSVQSSDILSQGPVWEVLIGNDTIVAVKKSHAKGLAIERVNYWYLIEESEQNDLYIDGLLERIDQYENEISLHISIQNSLKETIAIDESFISSYEMEVDILKDNLAKEKRKRWFAIGGTTIVIGGIATAILLL